MNEPTEKPEDEAPTPAVASSEASPVWSSDPKTPHAEARPVGHDELDPHVGLGMFLAGVLTMTVGGAADAHWVFDFGVLVAGIGAPLFVACVARDNLRAR